MINNTTKTNLPSHTLEQHNKNIFREKTFCDSYKLSLRPSSQLTEKITLTNNFFIDNDISGGAE